MKDDGSLYRKASPMTTAAAMRTVPGGHFAERGPQSDAGDREATINELVNREIQARVDRLIATAKKARRLSREDEAQMRQRLLQVVLDSDHELQKWAASPDGHLRIGEYVRKCAEEEAKGALVNLILKLAGELGDGLLDGLNKVPSSLMVDYFSRR